MGPEDLTDPKAITLSQLKAEALKFCVVTKGLGQSKANYVTALRDASAITASMASDLAEPGPGKQISAGRRLATAATAEEAVTPEGEGTEVMSTPAPGSSTALVASTSTAAAVLAAAVLAATAEEAAAPAEAPAAAEETEEAPAAEEAEEAAAAPAAEEAEEADAAPAEKESKGSVDVRTPQL